MHNLGFQFKRAHWKTIRVLMPLARAFGLTPQRFDILFALCKCGFFTQSSLAKHFDVSRTTIARMLKALENLGLIVRFKFRGIRSRTVELSSAGRALIVRALRYCKNPTTRLFEDAAMKKRRPRWPRALAVETAFDLVQKFARFLGDTSRLQYPFESPGLLMWLD